MLTQLDALGKRRREVKRKAILMKNQTKKRTAKKTATILTALTALTVLTAGAGALSPFCGPVGETLGAEASVANAANEQTTAN